MCPRFPEPSAKATRAEAKENVIDALRGILELRFGEHASAEPAPDSESLELVIAARPTEELMSEILGKQLGL